ncbi:MAG: DHH family phosphoesterase [Opitutaceae bacterium]|nr:DHH family phosphoesterase [Opitutaceae bacterium]
MKRSKVIFVAGHQRPDADAAASACMAARLKQRLDPAHRYQPILLGAPNAQTTWLFAEAGIDLPPERPDLRPTVGEVMNPRVTSVSHRARLADAHHLLQGHRFSIVPVLADDGRVAGILSPGLPQSQYLYHFNAEDFLGQLLDYADVVHALRLRRLNRCPLPAEAVPGSFVVAAAELGAGAPGRGDVLITGPSVGTVRAAAAAGVAGIIVCGGTETEARRCGRAAAQAPVHWFRGSIMALVSGLPLAIPVRNAMVTDFHTVKASQRADQVIDLVARTPYALPVLDEAGRLAGLFSRREALQCPPRPLILVDHFERTQTVLGFESAEVREIIDHHRVGSIETVHPVRVDCRPVGSTATIIACQFAEAGLKPAPAEALLLLGAIISDTLLLTSPTTTDTDRRVAAQLARRAKRPLADFGREVLRRNDELADGEPAKLVVKDLKEFAHGGQRFAAAQIETVDLGLLTAGRKAALLAALDGVRARLGVAFAALIVTDVFRGESCLLVSDPVAARADWLLEHAPVAEGRMHPGMVSRKKQLLPFLFHRLDRYRD